MFVHARHSINLIVFVWTLCTNPPRWIILIFQDVFLYGCLFMFIDFDWFYSGLPWAYLWQLTNPWIPFLWAYWAYLGPTLRTSTSLDSIALGLLCPPWAYRAKQQVLGFHWSGPTGPTMGLPWQRAHIPGFHCCGPSGFTVGLPCQPANHWIPLLLTYWAYLGHTLPTSKSLDAIALGLLGLPWAYLAKEQILGFHWFGPTGPTLAHLANKQMIGFHCAGPTEPTLGLPCQPTNPWITLFLTYWADLGHTLPTN